MVHVQDIWIIKWQTMHLCCKPGMEKITYNVMHTRQRILFQRKI